MVALRKTTIAPTVPSTPRRAQSRKPRPAATPAPTGRTNHDDATYALDQAAAFAGREHDAIAELVAYAKPGSNLQHHLSCAMIALYHARERIQRARAEIEREAHE